jgi:hypothetical protein
VRFQIKARVNFQRRILNDRENVKGIYHQPPSLDRENFIMIAEPMIPRMIILSIEVRLQKLSFSSGFSVRY